VRNVSLGTVRNILWLSEVCALQASDFTLNRSLNKKKYINLISKKKKKKKEEEGEETVFS
jgi:hypothetical protein